MIASPVKSKKKTKKTRAYKITVIKAVECDCKFACFDSGPKGCNRQSNAFPPHRAQTSPLI